MAEAALLQQVFEDIHQIRMQDMPMVNPALQVAVSELADCAHGSLGVLVTPWCMNLIIMPTGESGQGALPGSKHNFSLPCGEVEFVLAEEARLGAYYSCSLFSPMFEFADQAAALATAEAVLDSVLGRNEPPAPVIQKGETDMSRRNFLRGALRK